MTKENKGKEDSGGKKEEMTLVDKAHYEDLQARIAEYQDKYLRAAAELDNARKRMQKEKEAYLKFANEGLITELFPIMDSFDSAIAHAEDPQSQKNAHIDSFLKGIKLLQSKFHKVLEQYGLSPIKTVGEKFDPALHEAVEKVETDKFNEDVIVEEVRRGYLLNGMVLRPAIVKVAVKKEQ